MTLNLRTLLLASWVVLPVVATAQPAAAPDSKLAACLTEQDPEARLACFEAVAKNQQPAAVSVPAAIAAPPPYQVLRSPDGTLHSAGKWSVAHSVDSMTDKPRVRLINEGETEVGATNSKPLLGVVCFKSSLDVILTAGTFIGSRDTFRTTFRFDTASPQTQQWIISTTGKAVFSPAPTAFMAQLHGAERVIMEVTDFNGRTYRSFFDNAGIKDAVAEVSACWKPAAAQPAKPVAGVKPSRG
jgi:hypothetical protein